MSALEFQRRLRDAHERTARMIADREFSHLSSPDKPKTRVELDAYVDDVVDRLKANVSGTHREYGVHPNLDGVMALHAVSAFNARLGELLAAHGVPANDRGPVH